MEINASILNVDSENYIKTFYRIEQSHVDYFHIDVMDGEFVENNNVDLMIKYTDTLKNITNIPLSIHLMCKNIKKYIDIFAPSLPRIIYFHFEACQNYDEIFSMINYIKSQDIMVGIAINPETDRAIEMMSILIMRTLYRYFMVSPDRCLGYLQYCTLAGVV